MSKNSVFTQPGQTAEVPPEGDAGRILDIVAIPKTVTVHLGRPSAAAKNVTVSFTHYIKNVCSSEIYPTWPENAIRANIYCQISLVLNRIFTEWYRSKGYTFDITNSTSYDQYFVYGRNIFENISRIVDEIFNTYMNPYGVPITADDIQMIELHKRLGISTRPSEVEQGGALSNVKK